MFFFWVEESVNNHLFCNNVHELKILNNLFDYFDIHIVNNVNMASLL